MPLVYRYLLTALVVICFTHGKGFAQTTQPLYRIVQIKVANNFLGPYKQALQEQMEAAIQQEPGVLSYTAVAHKNDSTRFTIMEVYASIQAYQQHIQTAHFKKYKEAVKDMVVSLELIDTDWVLTAKKSNFK